MIEVFFETDALKASGRPRWISVFAAPITLSTAIRWLTENCYVKWDKPYMLTNVETGKAQSIPKGWPNLTREAGRSRLAV